MTILVLIGVINIADYLTLFVTKSHDPSTRVSTSARDLSFNPLQHYTHSNWLRGHSVRPHKSAELEVNMECEFGFLYSAKSNPWPVSAGLTLAPLLSSVQTNTFRNKLHPYSQHQPFLTVPTSIQAILYSQLRCHSPYKRQYGTPWEQTLFASSWQHLALTRAR